MWLDWGIRFLRKCSVGGEGWEGGALVGRSRRGGKGEGKRKNNC